MAKICIVTLGCDKNRCDSEQIAANLRAAGNILVASEAEAEIIVINTCGFIKSARAEAISVIREKALLGKKLYITGCLSKKYIPKDINFVYVSADAFLRGEESIAAVSPAPLKLMSTPPSYVYIKIAEGCNNHCSYCTIPSIKGAYRSRPLPEILAEVTHFAALDVHEFILVAQDVTKYSADGANLVKLIQIISKIRGVRRIRLLYVYPNGLDTELIREISENPKVCKYLDIPFQHVAPRIVKLMNRQGGSDEYLKLISLLREVIPNVTIRSTFMVGFPTETDDEVQILVDFLQKAQLDYVGFFKYSREPNTPAYALVQIPEKDKNKRLRNVEKIQSVFLEQSNIKKIGNVYKVVCDCFDAVLECSITRTDFMCPEVDPCVLVFGTALQIGAEYKVRITGTEGANLVGELI